MTRSFVIPAAGNGSPDSVSRKIRLAEAMLAQSMGAEPISSPLQGAAKLAQALMGGLAGMRADSTEQKGRAGAQEALVKALQGGRGVAPSQSDPRGDLVQAGGDPWQSDMGQRMIWDEYQRQNAPPPDPVAAEYARLRNEALKADIAKTQNPQAGGTEYGLVPQYGVDANKNPVPLQFGKNGTAIQTQLPAGVQLSRDPIKLDAGTHWVILDPVTRQQVGMIPKNIAEAAGEAVRGKSEAESQFSMPQAAAKVGGAIGKLEELRKHPGFNSAVGTWQGTGLGGAIGGFFNSDVADFRSRVNELKGTAFLQAYETLKGGGAIANAEGVKAEQAIARLNTAVGEKDFLTALDDYEAAIRRGYAAMQQQTGGGPDLPGGGQSPAPASDIDDLVRKYGGQ